jgi:NADH dehydrogenase
MAAPADFRHRRRRRHRRRNGRRHRRGRAANAGRPAPPPFRYLHLGEPATIGRRAAVVKLGRLQLGGFVGWIFWAAVHIYFLIGVLKRFIVAFNWLWTFLTVQCARG